MQGEYTPGLPVAWGTKKRDTKVWCVSYLTNAYNESMLMVKNNSRLKYWGLLDNAIPKKEKLELDNLQDFIISKCLFIQFKALVLIHGDGSSGAEVLATFSLFQFSDYLETGEALEVVLVCRFHWFHGVALP